MWMNLDMNTNSQQKNAYLIDFSQYVVEYSFNENRCQITPTKSSIRKETAR